MAARGATGKSMTYFFGDAPYFRKKEQKCQSQDGPDLLENLVLPTNGERQAKSGKLGTQTSTS